MYVVYFLHMQPRSLEPIICSHLIILRQDVPLELQLIRIIYEWVPQKISSLMFKLHLE